MKHHDTMPPPRAAQRCRSSQPHRHSARPPAHPRADQTGATLVVVLLILIVVTLLGVAASQIALLAEKSSRYDRDHQIAFQAAEAALIDAELDIRGPNAAAGNRVDDFSAASVVGFEAGCGTGRSRGLCLGAAEGHKPAWAAVDFLDDGVESRTVRMGEFTGRTFASGSVGIQPARSPRYVVEAIEDRQSLSSATSKRYLYRVTAIGFGPRVETQVVLQTVFRKE